MSDYPWYGLADGEELQQGDLFLGVLFSVWMCPEKPTARIITSLSLAILAI